MCLCVYMHVFMCEQAYVRSVICVSAFMYLCVYMCVSPVATGQVGQAIAWPIS